MAKDSFGQGHPFQWHPMEIETLKRMNSQGFHPEIYLEVPSDCIIITPPPDFVDDEDDSSDEE